MNSCLSSMFVQHGSFLTMKIGSTSQPWLLIPQPSIFEQYHHSDIEPLFYQTKKLLLWNWIPEWDAHSGLNFPQFWAHFSNVCQAQLPTAGSKANCQPTAAAHFRSAAAVCNNTVGFFDNIGWLFVEYWLWIAWKSQCAFAWMQFSRLKK